MVAREFKTVIGRGPELPDDHGQGRQSCVVVIAGENLGKVYPLRTDGPVLIGRSDQADIVCDDPLTSRRHAQIFVEKQAAMIMDLDSTNGTYLNFQKVQRSPLQNGDKISIGRTIFKYLDSDQVETAYHDEIYQLSSMDGLTQIYNRKKFLELLEKSLNGARRGDDRLCLCMMDLDFFKKINDTYGHQTGDYALRTVAAAVKKIIRREDIFARYGGEEFCLLFVNQTLEEGIKVAEKIRKTLEQYPYQFEQQSFELTVSMGVTAYEAKFQNAEAFLHDADAKLYEAKAQGRNRVVC